MAAGACRDRPDLSWFPELGESTAEAKAVCMRCSVRQECLEYAAADPDARRYGIWGGTSSRERRQARSVSSRKAG